MWKRLPSRHLCLALQDEWYSMLYNSLRKAKGTVISDVMSFVRHRLSLDLLRTCMISNRGYRCTKTLLPTAINDLNIQENNNFRKTKH